jgi:uncharacterized membrane protein
MEHEWIARAVLLVNLVGAGVLVLWVSLAAASGRLKRNHTAGIRTPQSMASDEAWLAAHVRARRSSVWASVVSIAAGFLTLFPLPMPTIIVCVLVAAAAMVGLALYGARVGGVAAAAVSSESTQ